MQLAFAELDGQTLHDINAAAATLSLRTIRHSVVPRREVSSRPRDDGAVDRSEFVDAALVELSGYCHGASDDDTESILDDLRYRFRTGTDHVLTFNRVGRPLEGEFFVFRTAEFDDGESGSYRSVASWGASLILPDPRIYALAFKNTSYDPTTAGSAGVDFKMLFPLEFGTSLSAFVTADNDGNFPSAPEIGILGPVTNPVVENLTTGQSIYTQNCSLAAGDFIAIYPHRTIAAGGGLWVPNNDRVLEYNGARRPDLIDPRLTSWFKLARGANNLQLRGSDMVTGQTTLSVSYRDATI
jgi:hypothetical protein